jgi:post-segregation antitoxin (ccd killing protein)
MIPKKVRNSEMQPIQVYINKQDYIALKSADADFTAIVRAAISEAASKVQKRRRAS